MGRRKESSKRMTQKQLAELIGMDPAVISRDWKPRFEAHGWPAFYEDGVDSIEFIKGIRKWDKLASERVQRLEGDPDERLKDQRSEKLQIEIQRMRGEQIYIPDFVDEIEKMQGEYVAAQSRLPRTVAAPFLAYIATLIADDIAKHPEVANAFEKIKQGDVENWLDEKFSKATGDMGKRLKQAWKNSIERARIRYS